MKKITLGILSVLSITVSIWATVPYTFSPNTPARASEVNSNFQALSDKFITLENNISNNTASIQETSGDCDKNVFSYTYQYTQSNIGDTITVGGVEYIMVALPFIEHGTGDHYYIKQPKIKSDGNSNIDLFIYFYTYYVQQGTACYPSTFSGFPAEADDGIAYRHFYNAKIDDPAEASSDLEIDNWASYETRVKINQTKFQLHFSIRNKLQKTLIASGDVDLRDDIDWSVLDINTSMVDDLKTLMNYVEIVKIP